MNKLKPVFTKFICFFSVILAGICLLGTLVSVTADKSIMEVEFHKYLFEKNNIYSHTQSLLNNSMNDFINSLKNNPAIDFDQHTDIFFVLQKSSTPEMIKINLDSIRNGLFEFFEGKRQFLPDVYLNTRSVPNSTTSLNSDTNKISYALTKIDKVNLSLILQYINRNDINDRLSFIKLTFFLLKKLPQYLIPIFLLLFTAVFLLTQKSVLLFKWAAASLVVCSILGFAASILLAIYSYSVLPKNIYPLISSIPLQSEVLISYIRDCINVMLKSLITFSIFFIILAVVLYLIPRFLTKSSNDANTKANKFSKSGSIVKYTTCSLLFILIISVLIYKFYIFKKEFYSNDFPVILSKIKNANTITHVISARDTVIYSMMIKIVDKKNNTPVSNVEVNVSGQSSTQSKSFNQTLTTDDLGEARYSLDKGTFRVSFSTTHFPTEYQLPSPFYFDLKTAGTKIITVNLENPPENNPKDWGIAEIEVLDKENKPVSDLDLSVQGIVSAPGFPNNVLSVTNSQGISVFKLNEGNFKIGFAETSFPEQYEIPSSIDVTITANTVTRYTIRLAEKKKSKAGIR